MAPDAIAKTPFLNIPETVSAEAQAYLRTLTDPALTPAFPDPADTAGWTKLQAFIEADALPKAASLVERYAPTVKERTIGGVPVLDVRPRGWTESGRLAVYTHGGAHTMYSARSMLGRAAMFADDTGLRTISVDYTLAPHAKFHAITDQVVAVVAGMASEGSKLADIVMYGDSSGGGVAASTILKMRDRGMGLPAAAILVSPWADITPAGDTEVTLRHAEPNYLYELHSVKAAGAYADPPDQKHPYASPVYGDFVDGFPPTLIQGGTKEILLSGFIRLYQAIDLAGGTVKLDLYEGMPHNFASRMPEAPESRVARRKIEQFILRHVSNPDARPLPD
jgi:acetyl esterase/lipase